MPTAVKISDDLVKKAKIRSRVFKRSILRKTRIFLSHSSKTFSLAESKLKQEKALLMSLEKGNDRHI